MLQQLLILVVAVMALTKAVPSNTAGTVLAIPVLSSSLSRNLEKWKY